VSGLMLSSGACSVALSEFEGPMRRPTGAGAQQRVRGLVFPGALRERPDHVVGS
jgi:hypothetical protein